MKAVTRAVLTLPRIQSVTALDGRQVTVVWRDGSRKIVDLAPALNSRRVYIPLRDDDELFRTLRVSEYGDAIEWDGGLDFSATWIDRLPAADFGNADIRDAMSRLGLTLDGTAQGILDRG